MLTLAKPVTTTVTETKPVTTTVVSTVTKGGYVRISQNQEEGND